VNYAGWKTIGGTIGTTGRSCSDNSDSSVTTSWYCQDFCSDLQFC